MIDASHNVPAQYSLSNLGFDVAIKTGTPQTTSQDDQNSFFIGFAPADDPEIAFAGVIEGGEYSKYMIRDIILAYQECYGLNGVEPTAKIPAEVRTPLDPKKTTTNTDTNTSTTTTIATTTTTTFPVTSTTTSTTTLPADVPVVPDQPDIPADLPPDTPEPEDPEPQLPPADPPKPEGGESPQH